MSNAPQRKSINKSQTWSVLWRRSQPSSSPSRWPLHNLPLSTGCSSLQYCTRWRWCRCHIRWRVCSLHRCTQNMHTSNSDSDCDLSFVHWRTLTLVYSLVVVAGLIWDPVFVSVLPNSGVISSVATAGITTVDHVLDRQIGRRPRRFALDVDAVWWESKHTLRFNINDKYKARQPLPVI